MRFISLFRIPICVLFLGSAVLAQSNPVPLINQLEPASRRPGTNGFELMVMGAGFAPTAVVNWNGSPRTTEVISSTRIKASISASDVAQIGTASVTVVNPPPGGGTSGPAFFPIRRPLSSLALALDPNLSVTGSVAVADFNNDGKLDVVVVENQYQGQSNSINLYYGNGDGTFQAPIQSPTNGPDSGAVVGDFNGDGILDIAVSEWSGCCGATRIYLGTSDGHFTEVPDNNPTSSGAVGVADFNNDGKLDLEIVEYDYWGSPTLYLALGNGDGTFSNTLSVVSLGYGLIEAAVADFNHDGNLDVAVVGEDSIGGDGVLYVVFGNGDGTFQSPVVYSANPRTQGAVIAADVNGDGILDLVTDEVCVYLGNRDGTFETPQCNGYGNTGSILAAGDFNGDGKIDLVTSDYLGDILIMLGNGGGTFQSPITLAEPASNFVAMGDFNGDGMLDLIASGSSAPALFLQTTASVSPTMLAFGNQAVGVPSSPQNVVLTNIGKSRLKISSIAMGGADPGDFSQTNNCGKGLAAGASCQIQVTFTPTALGARSASVVINSPELSVPQTVPLSGTGVTITISLTPSQMHFGTQLVNTTSPPQMATLTATGTYQVTIQGIAADPPFGQTNNCPTTLYPNNNCLIRVTFDPSQKGLAKGKLTVTASATNSPQSTVLTGVGTVVELSPVGVNFGDQKVGTKSAKVDVKLTNTGNTTLNVSQIGIAGKDPGDFSESNNCGTSIPPGDWCRIKVWFAPTQKGRRSAKVSIQDDGGGSPQEVPLVGRGT
jgi:hypothetical protein